jgi:hypothetical protein
MGYLLAMYSILRIIIVLKIAFILMFAEQEDGLQNRKINKDFRESLDMVPPEIVPVKNTGTSGQGVRPVPSEVAAGHTKLINIKDLRIEIIL